MIWVGMLGRPETLCRPGENEIESLLSSHPYALISSRARSHRTTQASKSVLRIEQAKMRCTKPTNQINSHNKHLQKHKGPTKRPPKMDHPSLYVGLTHAPTASSGNTQILTLSICVCVIIFASLLKDPPSRRPMLRFIDDHLQVKPSRRKNQTLITGTTRAIYCCVSSSSFLHCEHWITLPQNELPGHQRHQQGHQGWGYWCCSGFALPGSKQQRVPLNAGAKTTAILSPFMQNLKEDMILHSHHEPQFQPREHG